MNYNLEPSNLRKHIIQMASAGNSVHIACAFSLVEIVSVLYSKIMKFNIDNPSDPTRDYLALSKGHGVMALYACFKEFGWLDQSNFDNYFSDGSLLHGLGEAKIPGIEVTGGSLGHGLPIAVGVAYGIKRLGENRRVYCIVGDGEINEGTVWESLLFAGHHKLDNLTVIVDANGLQAMGSVSEIMSLEPLKDKFASFNFDTFECNGHNLDELETNFIQMNNSNKPSALIARTVKGKGVSFMEGQNEWHYMRLNPETLRLALNEIQKGGSNA